ncbi:deoxyribose-phosphate aldolase [Ornithinibacillus sp. BX22]|uniref:Deoxyribose-phosphate aldolase n=2 Tax=Ornithinibacillus TaxID=484508 RepID=A0A923RJI0_9BACI|nr:MULTISPECIES: deoxyribose-phosphate aldolase [Ornithinibacillus]MBC5638029.1 deoxyribose-phosphate aldolase [Ornithinibacillus hominis]MBS3681916.1 deoxyribose-phosphate aldolase [Ornithinibacillus massiliensis]
MNKQELIDLIDYTLLTPTATKADIKAFCEETIEYGFKTVFVNPYYVSYAHELLSPHGIKVGVPIGFSLGGATTHVKVEETKEAIKNGATEIDMLVNLGALKSGEYDVVRDDIAAVVKAADGLTTKVIIETALLTDEEKVKATELIIEAGADFVKTATGFNGGGATVEDVKLLRSVAGDKIGVKAAGGVKTFEDAVNIVAAGANRIGASGAVAIVSGGVSTSSY